MMTESEFRALGAHQHRKLRTSRRLARYATGLVVIVTLLSAGSWLYSPTAVPPELAAAGSSVR